MDIICVVTNDIYRFKILTGNLPSNIKDYKLVFVTDPRLGNSINDFKQLYSDAEFISSNEVLNFYHDDLHTSDDNINKYPLGYKIILPWYISKLYNFDKLLMLDDDIIITEKIKELFDSINGPSVYATYLMHKKTSFPKLDSDLICLALRVNEIDENKIIPYINGGHIMFTKDINYDEYISRIKIYMENPITIDLINKQEYWWSYYIDEVFFSALFQDYSKKYDGIYDLHKYVMIHSTIDGIGNSLKKHAVLHFAPFDTNTLYPQLLKKGYLKGDE